MITRRRAGTHNFQVSTARLWPECLVIAFRLRQLLGASGRRTNAMRRDLAIT